MRGVYGSNTYFIGTMIGFIGFGELPELGKKVKTFSALAPVATVGHIEGAMRVLSYFKGEVEVNIFLENLISFHLINLPLRLKTIKQHLLYLKTSKLTILFFFSYYL